MKTERTAARDMDAYIGSFPDEVREILERIRMTIRKAAPRAEEKIAYGIPTFTLNGNLVHFGAFKKHIGFYPTSSGIAKFKRELSAYKGSRGTVQFPFDEPVPYDLIGKIVKFRVQESMKKAR